MECEVKSCTEEIEGDEDGTEFSVSTWGDFGTIEKDDVEVYVCKKHHEEAIKILEAFKKDKLYYKIRK